MTTLDVFKNVKSGSSYIANASTQDKNKMLGIIADALVKDCNNLINANSLDIKAAVDKPASFIDRLKIDKSRIEGASSGVKKLIELNDPIGEIIDDWVAVSGIRIVKTRVPLGVIGIIYEARPLVTVDAIALCLKTGNAIVLRGSKDAINSNIAIVKVIKDALVKNGYNADFIDLVLDTSRDSAKQLMQARDYIDVLIPRGSAALITEVVNNSSVPVIETGAGNCHAYIEKTADLNIAKNIILNGKLSRPSVCNALESILVDKSAKTHVMSDIIADLMQKGVEIVGCSEACKLDKSIKLATDKDFYTEFLSLKISVKIVDGVDEAIAHINKHSTKHSEVIISQDKAVIEKFLNQVDSAAVYANASTRFTDGFEFGFGAEMGISTQKLHARGPMGLNELTSQKYKVYGDGQVR